MRIITVLVLLLGACATDSTMKTAEHAVVATQIAHPTSVTTTTPSVAQQR